MKIMLPAFLGAMQNGEDLAPASKFLTQSHVKLITKFLVTRAKISYGDFLYRLCAVFLDEDIIPVYGEEENLKIRYLKMFRTFDDCIFCKNFSYEFYNDSVKDFLEYVEKDRAKSFNNIRDKVRATKTDLGRFKAILPKETEEFGIIAKYEKLLTSAFLMCIKLSKSVKKFEGYKVRIEQGTICSLPTVFLDKVKN